MSIYFIMRQKINNILGGGGLVFPPLKIQVSQTMQLPKYTSIP